MDSRDDKLNTLDLVAIVLVIIGGINWGLIGFFNWNLVGAICGGDRSALARVIYAIVGLAALYLIYLVSRLRRRDG